MQSSSGRTGKHDAPMPKAAVAETLVHGSARRGELIDTHSG